MGTGGIVGTVIGVIAFLVIFFLILYFVLKRQNKYKVKTKKHKSIPGYYWSSVQNKYVPLDSASEKTDEAQEEEEIPLQPLIVVSDIMECEVSDEQAQRLYDKYNLFIEDCIHRFGQTYLILNKGHFNNPLNAFIYGYQKYNGSIELLYSEDNEVFALIYDLAVKNDIISIDELQFYEDKKNTLYLVVNPNFATKCHPDTEIRDLLYYIDAWHYLKDADISKNCKNPFIKYLVSDKSLNFDPSTSEDVASDFAIFTSKIDLTKSTESDRLIKGVIYSAELRKALDLVEKKWVNAKKEDLKEILVDFIGVKSDFISKVDKIDLLKDPIVTNDDIQLSLKYFELDYGMNTLTPAE